MSLSRLGAVGLTAALTLTYTAPVGAQGNTSYAYQNQAQQAYPSGQYAQPAYGGQPYNGGAPYGAAAYGAQQAYPAQQPGYGGYPQYQQQPSQGFASQPPNYVQSQLNSGQPTIYGYAADVQRQDPNAYQPYGAQPGYAASGPQGYSAQQPAYAFQPSQSQPPLQDQANAFFNQIDQQQQPQTQNQPPPAKEGPGLGSKLASGARALAGVAVPMATGYFLTKAANREAQLMGVPSGGIFGNPYYSPYGGYGGYPYGGYGNPYGSPASSFGGMLGRFGL